jgi:hypothetical protein
MKREKDIVSWPRNELALFPATWKAHKTRTETGSFHHRIPYGELRAHFPSLPSEYAGRISRASLLLFAPGISLVSSSARLRRRRQWRKPHGDAGPAGEEQGTGLASGPVQSQSGLIACATAESVPCVLYHWRFHWY